MFCSKERRCCLYIDPEIAEAVKNANELYSEANADILRVWLDKMVFSWRWWVNIGLLIIPWVFWMLVRNKKQTHCLLFSALVLIIITSYLDMLGMSAGLWGYRSKVLPLIPPYLKWDFTLLPVTAMLFYQVRQDVHPSVKALIFSGIGSFIIQPLFQWLGFYHPQSWPHFYSYPLLFVIYLIGYRAYIYRLGKEESVIRGD